MSYFDNESDYYSGSPVTADAIQRAEESLGVKLPSAYVDLLGERNGGYLVARCFPSLFPTSWAPDHIGVDVILGIGSEGAIDCPRTGSRYMIAEWGYPDVGVVICVTPSAGHDTVMLDYSECGPQGEPTVVYVDEDRVPRQIAASFTDFVAGLIECPDPEPD